MLVNCETDDKRVTRFVCSGLEFVFIFDTKLTAIFRRDISEKHRNTHFIARQDLLFHKK